MVTGNGREMRLCKCHGKPQAPNGSCMLKRRATQHRYESTEKGIAVARRYKHGPKGLMAHRRYDRKRLTAKDATTAQKILAMYPDLEVFWSGKSQES